MSVINTKLLTPQNILIIAAIGIAASWVVDKVHKSINTGA